MPSIAHIISAIEDFAPLHFQESWDNCGLQVGCELDREATGALLALDVTEAAVAQAKVKGLNLIISHHPLIFDGLRTITERTATERIVIEALRCGIVIYASHTAMDSCRGGINDRLAQTIGLRDVTVLAPHLTDLSAGMGRVGRLANGLTASDFADLLKAQFKLPSIRYSDGGRLIERVSLCGGSGGSMIGDVEKAGVDAYVCGDLKYHNFGDAAANHLSIFDIGHYESEICVLDIFSDIIRKKFPTFVALNSAYNFITYS